MKVQDCSPTDTRRFPSPKTLITLPMCPSVCNGKKGEALKTLEWMCFLHLSGKAPFLRANSQTAFPAYEEALISDTLQLAAPLSWTGKCLHRLLVYWLYSCLSMLQGKRSPKTQCNTSGEEASETAKHGVPNPTRLGLSTALTEHSRFCSLATIGLIRSFAICAFPPQPWELRRN